MFRKQRRAANRAGNAFKRVASLRGSGDLAIAILAVDGRDDRFEMLEPPDERCLQILLLRVAGLLLHDRALAAEFLAGLDQLEPLQAEFVPLHPECDDEAGKGQT